MRILLGWEEVKPDKPNVLGKTPLSNAAQNRHERVVKILLGWEKVNLHKPEEWGRTPFACCSEGT